VGPLEEPRRVLEPFLRRVPPHQLRLERKAFLEAVNFFGDDPEPDWSVHFHGDHKNKKLKSIIPWGRTRPAGQLQPHFPMDRRSVVAAVPPPGCAAHAGGGDGGGGDGHAAESTPPTRALRPGGMSAGPRGGIPALPVTWSPSEGERGSRFPA